MMYDRMVVTELTYKGHTSILSMISIRNHRYVVIDLLLSCLQSLHVCSQLLESSLQLWFLRVILSHHLMYCDLVTTFIFCRSKVTDQYLKAPDLTAYDRKGSICIGTSMYVLLEYTKCSVAVVLLVSELVIIQINKHNIHISGLISTLVYLHTLLLIILTAGSSFTANCPYVHEEVTITAFQWFNTTLLQAFIHAGTMAQSLDS